MALLVSEGGELLSPEEGGGMVDLVRGDFESLLGLWTHAKSLQSCPHGLLMQFHGL